MLGASLSPWSLFGPLVNCRWLFQGGVPVVVLYVLLLVSAFRFCLRLFLYVNGLWFS